MKKAQTEMLGIAIVVILISIGILFIVSNAMKSSSAKNQKTEFSERQLATNILASILSTSTECQNDRVSTLMIDCGSGDTGRLCGGENVSGVAIGWTDQPCIYLKDVITVMLNETLGKWKKKYQFLAYADTTHILININNSDINQECLSGQGTGLRYIQTDSYYLPLYLTTGGTMTVELSLCS